MNTQTKNGITLASILLLIFCIPFYFSWHTPDKNMITHDLSAYSMSKKTKSHVQQINEDEYNKLFQERFGHQPILFNETQHSLAPIQLIPEQVVSPSDDHDELLRHLKSHKRKLQRMYPRPFPARKPAYEHQTHHHTHIHLDDAVEQFKSMHQHVQEKVHTTVAWYRRAMEQFQKMAQNHLAHHMQRIMEHEKEQLQEASPNASQTASQT